MPIAIACKFCDWNGKVKDELAGKNGKCPTCGELVPIPNTPSKGPPPLAGKKSAVADDEPDIVDDADFVEDEDDRPKPKPRPSAGRSVGSALSSVGRGGRDEDDEDRPRSRSRRDEDDEDEPRPRSRKRYDDDDDRPSQSRRRDVDDDDEPRSRSRRRSDDDDTRPRRPRKRKRRQTGTAINGGVAAGLLMMGGAAIWFIVGFALGRVFFYPPILFVLGAISFFRGLSGHED